MKRGLGVRRWVWALLCAACGGAPSVVSAPAPLEAPPTVVEVAAPAEPAWVLVAGGVTACASTLAAGPACWGSWADAVPVGEDFDPHAPRSVGTGVVEVAPGWTHTCVRTGIGAVRCDGRFDVGGAVTAEPSELVGATHLVSGRDFTCGLVDARLACFAARPYAGLSSAGLGPLRALAATSSGWQLCALAEERAWCWASIDRPPVSVAVPAGTIELAVAPDRGCARTREGALSCWSLRDAAPSARVVDGVRAEVIAALHDRVCARDGDRWTCLDPATAAPAPVSWLEGARAIAGGMGFVCAAYADGIRCRGDDDYGQLGAFGAPSVAAPTGAVRIEARGAAQLALGRAHACIVTTDARVACWGSNEMGQLGDRTRGVRTTPRVVPGLGRVVEVHAGQHHTCARTDRGELHCWGTMLIDHGEDVDPVWRRFPVSRVLGTGVVAIGSGTDDVCAVRDAPPSLRCWGSIFVVPGGDWLALPEPGRAITTRASETCVLGDSGRLWCVEGASSELAADDAWRGADVIAASESSRCATVSGAVRCAGRNERGELGDGTRTTRAEPVAVRGVEGATGLAIGDAHACAVLSSGEVRCWGANTAGQLGDGTHADRWRAVPVVGVADAVEVAAAGATSCARLAGGSVACWGAPLGVSEEEVEQRVEAVSLFP